MTRPSESAQNCHECANASNEGGIYVCAAFTSGVHQWLDAVGFDAAGLPPRETPPCPNFVDRNRDTPDPARDEAPDLRHRWTGVIDHGRGCWWCTYCRQANFEDPPPGGICRGAVTAALADRDAEILRLRTERAWLIEEVVRKSGSPESEVLACMAVPGVHKPVLGRKVGEVWQRVFAAEDERDDALALVARLTREREAMGEVVALLDALDVAGLDKSARIGESPYMDRLFQLGRNLRARLSTLTPAKE